METPNQKDQPNTEDTVVGISKENLRHVVVPIPTEVIREYLSNKELFFLADHSNSRLKNSAFLTYVTNLAVPSDVIFTREQTYEEYSEFMLAYFSQRSVCHMAAPCILAAQVILTAKGIPYEETPYVLMVPGKYVTQFIAENKEMIARWLHFFDSMQVFAIASEYKLRQHYKPKERFEIIEDREYVGVNAAQLLRVPEFTAYYFANPKSEYRMSYFSHQFEDYVFKNERLISYFISPNNLSFFIFQSFALGEVKPEDFEGGILNIGVFDKNSKFYEPSPFDPTAYADEQLPHEQGEITGEPVSPEPQS